MQQLRRRPGPADRLAATARFPGPAQVTPAKLHRRQAQAGRQGVHLGFHRKGGLVAAEPPEGPGDAIVGVKQPAMDLVCLDPVQGRGGVIQVVFQHRGPQAGVSAGIQHRVHSMGKKAAVPVAPRWSLGPPPGAA